MHCRALISRTTLVSEASDGFDMFSAWRKTSTTLVPTLQTTPTATTQPAPPTTPILSREVTSVSWPLPHDGVLHLPTPDDAIKLRRVWNGGTSPKPQPSAQAHATELLAWLQKDPLFSGCLLLADDLQYRLYPGFCLSMGWRRRPWNSVARHLKALTGNRKIYKWVEVNGEVRRLRVYAIPPLT